MNNAWFSKTTSAVLCILLAAYGGLLTATSTAKAYAEANTHYQGRRISVDLKEANIHNALNIIAEVSGLNIVIHGEVSGKVSLQLVDVPWDQVLDILLRMQNLYAVREGNVIMIVPLQKVPNLFFSE